MNQAFVDLHTHTKASDGLHSPAENVRMAKAADLAAIAITDHDTVLGIREAALEGERLGIEVVAGVEISTEAGGQDIHILGYYIDPENERLLERLEGQRQSRLHRNAMIIEKLQRMGMNVKLEELTADRKEKETIGRPHIAQLLIKKGYVRSMEEAFSKYIGEHGTAYVRPPRIGPKEAITWIHEAGGAAVIAHPGLYGDDKHVESIIGLGLLDGLEAYHSDHSEAACLHYAAMAKTHGLIVTAGSDFHGKRGDEVYHAAIGTCRIGIEVLEQLQQRKGR